MIRLYYYTSRKGRGIVRNICYACCMKQFTKLSIQTVPVEEAHGGSGARQMLVRPEHVATPFLDAVTKGYLKSGGMFDWHNHPDTDEIFIVTQGEGEYHYREGEVDEKYN